MADKESFGTSLRKNVWGFLKDAAHFTADTAEAWLKGATKWALSGVDMLWDAGAFVTDLSRLTDNAWAKEWFLDRNVKDIKENIDSNDVIKSKWGESDLGKWVLGGAEFIWEVLTPGVWALGAAWKAIKGFKYGKEALTAFRNEPKIIAELNALKTAGKKVDGETLNKIVEKYGLQNVSNASGKVAKTAWELKDEAWLIPYNTELARLVKEDKTVADIVKKLSKMSPKEVEAVVSKYPRLKGLVTGIAGKTLWASVIGWVIASDDNEDQDEWISLPPSSPTNKELSDLDKKVGWADKWNADVIKFHGYEIKKTPDGKVSFVSRDPKLWTRTFNSLEEAQSEIVNQNTEEYLKANPEANTAKKDTEKISIEDSKTELWVSTPNKESNPREGTSNVKTDTSSERNEYARNTKAKNELADLIDKEWDINTYEDLAKKYKINLPSDFDQDSSEDLENFLTVLKTEWVQLGEPERNINSFTAPNVKSNMAKQRDQERYDSRNVTDVNPDFAQKELSNMSNKLGLNIGQLIEQELKANNLPNTREGKILLAKKLWTGKYDWSPKAIYDIVKTIQNKNTQEEPEPITM